VGWYWLIWVYLDATSSSCQLFGDPKAMDRVSTTPGNPGNLLEFVWSSWKFLGKMSMINCIGFQS